MNRAKAEVEDGIANFEQTLRSNGINPRVDKDVAQQAVTNSFGKGSPLKASVSQTKSYASSIKAPNQQTTKTGAFTLESTGLKHRTKKTLTEATRKQREKRRRRLIGQQEELMQELELKQREAMVTELMKKQSAQERELDYEVWRTNQCKEIISKNRQLRET